MSAADDLVLARQDRLAALLADDRTPTSALAEAAAEYAAAVAAATATGHPGHGQPRAFLLRRNRDVSGVSGTGVVAQGVEFADGTVALRWLVLPDAPTSVVFHDNGVESVERVHGHDGLTVIEWADRADAFSKAHVHPVGRTAEETEEAVRDVLAEGPDQGAVWMPDSTVHDLLHVIDRLRGSVQEANRRTLADEMSRPLFAEHPEHPHGSTVEQIHRVITTDQGVDAWTLAESIDEVTRARARREIADEVEALAANRDPADPEGSHWWSRAYERIAARIRHPERYSGAAQGQGGQAVE